jgi:hypothetical protein
LERRPEVRSTASVRAGAVDGGFGVGGVGLGGFGAGGAVGDGVGVGDAVGDGIGVGDAVGDGFGVGGAVGDEVDIDAKGVTEGWFSTGSSSANNRARGSTVSIGAS